MKGPKSFKFKSWLILFTEDGRSNVYAAANPLKPVSSWSRVSAAVRWCEEQEDA